MKKSMLFTLLMATSPTVFAQQYSATVADLNSIFEPPLNVNEVICKTEYDVNIKEKKEACEDGVVEARRMAEKHAQKVGKFLGCMDGYFQGIKAGYYSANEPTGEMREEANAYVAGARMDSAIDLATEDAQKSAETESANSIIQRYRDVLNQKAAGNQVLPDKTPRMPEIRYPGITNGYEIDIVNGTVNGGSFKDAINAGYINNNSSFEDKIAARKAFKLQIEHARDLCDVNQTIFGRRDNIHQLTLWDYLKVRRTERFEKYGWNDGAWAWDIYAADKDLGYIDLFEQLKITEVKDKRDVYKTVNKLDANGQAIPVLNADGTPKLNPDGTTVYETERVFSHSEFYVRKVNDAELTTLKNSYRAGFVKAYQSYYARKYASLKYHEEGLAKYAHARDIGKLIGESVAENVARKEAYDNRYKQVSLETYAAEAEKKYMAEFNRLMGIFENNPVVELTDTRIIGTNERDGIFTPGENLVVDLSVTNLGEVAAPVTFRVHNSVDVIANQAGHEFTPTALDRTEVKTGVVGTISNDSGARDQITVNMSIDNPSNLNEIATAIRVNDRGEILVNEYLEITGASARLNLMEGLIETDVNVANPANEGYDPLMLPKVRTSIAGTAIIDAREKMKVLGGQSESFHIPSKAADPLQIIRNNGATINVESILGNKTTDRRVLKVGLGTSQSKAYVRYFNAVLTNQTQNTGDKDKNTRLGELVGIIEGHVDNTLNNHVIKWKRQNEVDDTIIGDIQRVYNEAKAAGLMNDEVQGKYTELAMLLAKKIHNRGSSRVRGLDKHYLKQLKKFGGRKFSIKPKDHK